MSSLATRMMNGPQARAPLGPQAQPARPANLVDHYKRQMAAATTPYAQPALPARAAYPAGGMALLDAHLGTNYGPGGMTEHDQAAHVLGRVASRSPMARYAQDTAHAGQVAATAQGIAGHRQMEHGQWGQNPAVGAAPAPASPYSTPYPQAQAAPTATAPVNLGVPPRPAPKLIGLRGPAQQPQAPPTTPPVPAVGGVPHAYGPVVPGVDYARTPIVPAPNSYQADQGSRSFNWRLHPGMAAPTAAELEAHPYQDSRSRRGPDTGYGAAQGGPAGDPATAMVNASLNQQLHEAFAQKDAQGVARATGLLEAMNKGGVSGMLDYGHKEAMQEAQREQAGAKIGLMNRGNGGNVGIYNNPEHARDAIMAKTGDPALAQQAMQTQRITQAVAADRGGQRANFDPNDAQAYLEQYHPILAPKFRVNQGGSVEGGNLADLHKFLNTTKPQGWDDPNSLLGRVLGVRIPQAYGADLAKQTQLHQSPEENRRLAGLNKNSDPFNVFEPIMEYAGGVANNIWNRTPTLFPGTAYADQKAAVEWLNRLRRP